MAQKTKQEFQPTKSAFESSKENFLPNQFLSEKNPKNHLRKTKKTETFFARSPTLVSPSARPGPVNQNISPLLTKECTDGPLEGLSIGHGPSN